MQAVAQAGPAENPVREAEADQRLRPDHGHVRHPGHDRRERAVVGRSVHKGKSGFIKNDLRSILKSTLRL